MVACSRSSLEPQSFFASMAPWVNAVSLLPCIRVRTAEHALGFVGLSHMGSQLCVTDQGDTGGHAVSSGQSVVRSWHSAGSAAARH